MGERKRFPSYLIQNKIKIAATTIVEYQESSEKTARTFLLFGAKMNLMNLNANFAKCPLLQLHFLQFLSPT